MSSIVTKPSYTPVIVLPACTGNEGPPAHLVSPVAEVDAYLNGYVAGLAIPGNLKEAVQYALLGGGKRLRPVLAWHCAAAVGGKGPASLPGGAAVELVHAFSLVHDDLPAMDDDEVRRGRPTLHIARGEAMAILAGDLMLNMGFELLLANVQPAMLAGPLCAELAAGTSGMIAGQVFDTLGGFEGGESDAERLAIIHRHKTGALIRAACRMGAQCGMGSATGHGLLAITTYADAVGLMFQIVDDILDVTQPAEHVGKKTGKDVQAGKLTYPGVLGLEQARAEVKHTLRVALEAIKPLGPAAKPLAELAEYMAVRTK